MIKITFLAVPDAPDSYEIDGLVLTAKKGSEEKEYDFGEFPTNGHYLHAAPMSDGTPVIFGATRPGGVLHVVLGQAVIAGQYPEHKAHWRESPIIDTEDYDPGTCYVIPTGMAGVDDYEIVQGVDVAGNTGWTVRKKEMADG